MPKIYLCNGNITHCIRRSIDAKKLKEYFLRNDYALVGKPGEADEIVVVTCAVTKWVEDLGIEKIEELKKYNARMTVVGCLPAISGERLAMHHKGPSLATKDMEKIDEYFEHETSFKEIADGQDIHDVYDEGHPKELEESLKCSFPQDVRRFFDNLEPSREFFTKACDYVSRRYLGRRGGRFCMKISQGCQWNCSYCRIRVAVGGLRSNSLETCLKDFKTGLDRGYKYFTLSSDDLGSYGLDTGTNIIELLDRLTSIEGDYRISLDEFHPFWPAKYQKELMDILDRGKIVCLQSALESGNKRVLGLMRRKGDIGEVKSVLKEIRLKHPYIVLNSQFITGFPTETREEFMETLETVREIDFVWGQFFRYTDRKIADSYNIEPKVSESEKSERMMKAAEFLERCGYKTLLNEDTLTFMKKRG